MKAFKKVLILVVFVTAVAAQSTEPPINDTRLTIHTLVREDIFAGFLADDMERFARGERNIDRLLELRPAAKAELLAWKGGAALYRAVRAHENNRREEYERTYQKAVDLFAQARKEGPGNGGVAAVVGGSYVLFADRLPQQVQADAWAQSYEAFNVLWKQQAPVVDKLPVHLRGELLAGLAQSAHRTGHKEEMALYLDKIIELLPNTPYEPVAKKWKQNPEAAAKDSISCMTCHDAGRLSARLASLK